MNRLADWAYRPRDIQEWLQLAVTGLVLVGCTLFVFVALHPSKLFLNTLTAGGDMGAHVWAPAFLKNHLFPHGRISGWAPDWYDGFPALTFYFPGPYVVIALMSYVIPYDIAFKLVSVSGCVFLPLSAYAFGRLIKMKFPGPQLLAIATVPYLFDRYWTIYGGNIASTLAGEFCFEIALCFALLFIGVFAKSLETGRYRWLAALLLAATVLCHILPAFFAIAGAVLVWLLQPTRRRLGIAVLVGGVGLAVAGFWLIPFAVRNGYSNDMGWTRTTAFMKGLFPFMCNTHKQDTNINCPAWNVTAVYTMHLKIVDALGAAGVLCGLLLRRRSTLLIAGLGLASAAAFRLMPQGTLWNARVLPFWYLSVYLAAAACLSESALAVGVLLGRSPRVSDDAFDDTSPGGQPDWSIDVDWVDADAPRHLVGAGVGGGPTHGMAGSGWEDSDRAPPAQWAVPGSDGGDAPGEDAGPGFGGWWREDDEPSGAGPSSAGPWAAMTDDDWHDWSGRSSDGGRRGELIPNGWPALVAPLLVLFIVLAFVAQALPDYAGIYSALFLGHHPNIGGVQQRLNPNFDSSWANWNYSGYQEKSSYPEYADVMTMMNGVGKQYGCGRALWEYEPEENRFGTPMALMLLPTFTNGCIDSEEGLFFESSSTVPYHFLNQSELSENPSRAMVGLPYRNFDILDGIQHLQLLGVKYYMAISPAAIAAAKTLTTGPNPMLTLVGTSGTFGVQYTTGATTSTEARTWQVFEVSDSDQVAPLAYEPAVLTHAATTGPGWNKLSVAWYQDASRWNVFLAASGPKNWPRVKASADSNPPEVPVRPTKITNIVNTDDSISFDVDKPGSPVVVKTSYFPNWQAIGADGPWRVTPNLMVVVPTSTHVVLHYGFTPVDNAGRLASVGGVITVGTLWWLERGGAEDEDSSDGPADEALSDDSDRIWGDDDLPRPAPSGGPGPAPPGGWPPTGWARRPPPASAGPGGPVHDPVGPRLDAGNSDPGSADRGVGGSHPGSPDPAAGSAPVASRPESGEGPWSGPWSGRPGSGSSAE
jgi:hypothetical protein